MYQILLVLFILGLCPNPVIAIPGVPRFPPKAPRTAEVDEQKEEISESEGDGGEPSHAEDPQKSETKVEGSESGDGSKKESDKFAWRPAKQKEFTKNQIAAECKKYENSYVGYYGRIFYIKNCKRLELADPDLVSKLLKNWDLKVLTVDGDTIFMLPVGPELNTLPNETERMRSCAELEGEYIIYGGSEIYLVDNCKRREFPDYETYLEHARSRNKAQVIVELTSPEFYRIKEGSMVPSIMPASAKKLMEKIGDVDIIDIATACAGLEGKYVGYYESIYLIEKCKKRPVLDIVAFLGRSATAPREPLYEMTSEQWISLPSGEPVGKSADSGEKNPDELGN